MFSGVLISALAFITYFVLVPSWPDLRDSGLPSVILAAAGALLSLWGLSRALRARRWRVSSAVLSLIALALASFLYLYIFHLTYMLPSTEGVVAVGARAPSFRLLDQEGRERSLEEFAGRPALILFFRGHW